MNSVGGLKPVKKKKKTRNW